VFSFFKSTKEYYLMKKLTIALAIAGAFAATGANASVTLGQYGQGCVVPSAFWNANSNTVVGITSTIPTPVYWTFFDVNSNHVTDGQFTMTGDDQYAFDWSAQGGSGTSGLNGYLVFTSSPTSALATQANAIACNAFQISAGDAAFLPAPYTLIGDYSAPGINLTTMTPTSLIGLSGGTPQNATNTHMRYWIDGATGGRDTAVVVWTTNAAADTYTVNIYDDAQNRKSVNFTLPNAELNIINPETIVGRPATYLDGFIDWNHGTAAAPITGVAGKSAWVAADHGFLTYSVVSDPAFGATQTLTAPTFP
jgi:hypothetical protein